MTEQNQYQKELKIYRSIEQSNDSKFYFLSKDLNDKGAK